MVKTVTCPQCGNSVPWQDDQLWKPFCSERCKLIDLGDWASENHRIKGEELPPLNSQGSSDFH
ncbi:DNA gyrase inhibitor YacG [Methylophaga sp. 42_25_T18]|nr:DNA gyrase inhibitor YacG [Methylophaga sp. 42_25_T18]OUR86083.1 DNA gyrase inhibitor YacG [Methylophaga sp. 42_8_T64]